MKSNQLITVACLLSIGSGSCTYNASIENKMNPVLDTVRIHPDSLKNMPIPDSTFDHTDTLAIHHQPISKLRQD